jgi:hypothetical protein
MSALRIFPPFKYSVLVHTGRFDGSPSAAPEEEKHVAISLSEKSDQE